MGAGLILTQIGGVTGWCTPAAAAANAAPFRSFTAAEADLLGAFGDAIVRGSRAAGLAHFIDHHVTVPSAESLLTLRYLDVPPPYLDFYRAGLAALGPLATAMAHDWDKVIAALGGGTPAGWTGPPAALLYFVVRSDAIDMAYGTRPGFERLGVEYLAHIEPETDF